MTAKKNFKNIYIHTSCRKKLYFICCSSLTFPSSFSFMLEMMMIDFYFVCRQKKRELIQHLSFFSFMMRSWWWFAAVAFGMWCVVVHDEVGSFVFVAEQMPTQHYKLYSTLTEVNNDIPTNETTAYKVILFYYHHAAMSVLLLYL